VKDSSITSQRWSSSQRLVINAVGTDRLGIVSDMTQFITKFGGNVGECRAAKLGSNFSLMMVAFLPVDNVDSLMAQLKSAKNVKAVVYSVPKDDSKTKTPEIGYSGRLTLEGADNCGIVHRVTSLLSEHGLSIGSMETSKEIAGGTVVFEMNVVVHAYKPLASRFDTSKLKLELNHLGKYMNCDIFMEDTVEDHINFFLNFNGRMQRNKQRW